MCTHHKRNCISESVNSLENLENQTGTISKVYPVKLALLKHFFNDTQLENVLANTTYKKYMPVIIPDLKVFKHKMSGILTQDKKFDINLKQIAERVKNSITIYNYISDAYLEKQFPFDNGDPFDFKLLLFIVGLSLAVINLFTIIYVLRKIQLLRTALVMVHGACALSKEFHFQAPTESSKDIQKEVNGSILSALEWDRAIFVICTITPIMAIVAVIYR